MSIIYNSAQKIINPLIFLKPLKNHHIKFGSTIKITQGDDVRHGRVLFVDENSVAIEVFEETFGLHPNLTVEFEDSVFKISVSREMLGRRFNGLGKTLDDESILPEEILDINGLPINPIKRIYPKDVIQTGISTIDGLCTLIRGQKLPIFSGQGLPHNQIVAQIVANSTVVTKEKFITIFCGIGLLSDEALFFEQKFTEAGINNVIQFINLASDPSIERLLIPRIALTVAEFFAFTHNYHVLVVTTDMTNYAEALRQISNVKGEIPARKGFPGYMYSDFASLYERAGKIQGSTGSITQIPVLTMPNDNISHPIPDLTGYITEGQIVLSRNYHAKAIYPPINVLSSLSRLMKDGVGNKTTREDHVDLANQLYAAYSKALEIRELESILGSESLSDVDKKYLKYAMLFENKYIGQSADSERTFINTLNLGWKLLSLLGKSELVRVKKDYINSYFVSNVTEEQILYEN